MKPLNPDAPSFQPRSYTSTLNRLILPPPLAYPYNQPPPHPSHFLTSYHPHTSFNSSTTLNYPHTSFSSTYLNYPQAAPSTSLAFSTAVATSEQRQTLLEINPDRANSRAVVRNPACRFSNGTFRGFRAGGRDGFGGRRKKHSPRMQRRAAPPPPRPPRSVNCNARVRGRDVNGFKGSERMGFRRGSKTNLPLEREDHHTSVMIRNIPNRYTRDLLIQFLDNYCEEENKKASVAQSSYISNNTSEKVVSAYDFLYLPVDFGRKANKGYAFVNFTDPRAVWRFFEVTNNKSWDLFNSTKIRQIASARLQGKEELVRHFERSTFHCESDEYLPVCFSPPRDGLRKIVKETTVGTRVGNQI